jgi:hypothetical protein
MGYSGWLRAPAGAESLLNMAFPIREGDDVVAVFRENDTG